VWRDRDSLRGISRCRKAHEGTADRDLSSSSLRDEVDRRDGIGPVVDHVRRLAVRGNGNRGGGQARRDRGSDDAGRESYRYDGVRTLIDDVGCLPIRTDRDGGWGSTRTERD